MKKIGLCLAYKGTNYGMLLQAYATQQMLIGLGYQTEIIEYTNDRRLRQVTNMLRKVYLPIFQRPLFKRMRRKVLRILFPDFKRAYVRQWNATADFRSTRLTGFVHYRGFRALQEGSRAYHAVIVGSDQQWPPAICYSDVKTLLFAAPSVRRISYATSMGVSSYPYYVRKRAAEFLSKIDHISVREESAKRIINSLVSNPVAVVADPTLLITREEWERLLPARNPDRPSYILCYYLGNNPEHRRAAMALNASTGLRIISIRSVESYARIDLDYADESIEGATPEEFLNLIRYAEYVCTDSFHGVALSASNNRPFSVFYRTSSNQPDSRNSRIDHVLDKLGLADRLATDAEDVMRQYAKRVDYTAVNRTIDAFREESLQFLRNALA